MSRASDGAAAGLPDRVSTTPGRRAARTLTETAFAFAWGVYLFTLLKQVAADIALPLALGCLLVRYFGIKDVPRP